MRLDLSLSFSLDIKINININLTCANIEMNFFGFSLCRFDYDWGGAW